MAEGRDIVLDHGDGGDTFSSNVQKDDPAEGLYQLATPS